MDSYKKITNAQERTREHPLREIMNAILYINRIGCQWRLLPEEFGPWQTEYYYCKWRPDGVIEDMMTTLHFLAHKIASGDESPSIGIIDSRSVKNSHPADPDCKGIDGDKRIKGRKEHVTVDTFRLPMAMFVHEANLHDSKGASKVIERLAHKFPRLVKIFADGGYQRDLGDWMKKKFGWTMDVVLRPDERPSKFQVLLKRWIVERTFTWLENFRRLASTTNIFLTLPKRWFNSLSPRLCLTSFSNDFKTVS